jgi:ABC-type uncharacterized transport system involved in gliding motility auxiliary subunit
VHRRGAAPPADRGETLDSLPLCQGAQPAPAGDGEEEEPEQLSDDEEENREVNLEWRDYVAIVIAMFETVLVPVLVVLAVLLVLVLLIVFA